MIPQIEAYVPHVTLDQIVPFAILIIAGLLILALDALLDIVIKGITPERRDGVLTAVTGGAILVTGFTFFTNVLGTSSRPFFEGMLRTDEFGNLGALIILFAALVFVIMSPRVIKARRLPAGELYALLLFALSGMTLLTVANELVTAFICIEILSLALYVMAGIDRRSRKSSEAAFKYFILGAFASAFLVLGIGFLFGATGTTQLFGNGKIVKELQSNPVASLPTNVASYNLGFDDVLTAQERVVFASVPATEMQQGVLVQKNHEAAFTTPLNPVWIFVGFALVFVGLCFKLSLAPFHMWAPDVYEGAPTITAMFIATASKVAAFAFLIHLIEAMSFWPHFPSASGFIIGSVAVISILWGNLGALVQTNIKRMLAYSSVAHGGYMAVGVATLVSQGVFSDVDATERVRNGIIFYLFAYTLMNVLAFGIVAYLGKEGEGDIRSYRGFSKRHPRLAAGMALAMVSLLGLGVPGTVGIWGKFYIFKEAIDAGLVGLAIIAMIGTAISAYYYLRVVVAMYMQEEEPGVPLAGGELVEANGYRFAIALSSGMIVLFGVMPALFYALGGF